MSFVTIIAIITAFGLFFGAIAISTDNPLVFPETGEVLSGGNFHAEPVASHQQPPPPLVPKGKGKDAPQSAEALDAEIFIEVNDRFCIRFGSEAVPAADQFFAQTTIVVDFSIQGNPDGLIFIRDRLMPSGEIDNAQPAIAQSQGAFHVMTFIVRAAMGQGTCGGTERRLFHRSPGAEVIDSANSTHNYFETQWKDVRQTSPVSP